jgi:GDP-D-mannose dehydratase
MRDTTRPHAVARIYAYWEKGKPQKLYRVDILNCDSMIFNTMEEAKAWAAMALRT